MLSIVNNFSEDVYNAIQSNDGRLLIDVVCSEVAKIIIYDKGTVIDALSRNGKKKYDNNTTDETFVKELVGRMPVEQPLRRDIGLILLHNTTNDKTRHEYSANGHVIETLKPEKLDLSGTNEMIEKALVYVIKPENSERLKRCIRVHREVKVRNFGAGGTVATDSKAIKRLKIKTALKYTAITVAVIGAGLLIMYVVANIKDYNSPGEATGGNTPPASPPVSKPEI